MTLKFLGDSYRAPLRQDIPPDVIFSRPAGLWSRFTGVPVFGGAVAIEHGSAIDTPRISWVPGVGWMLLIECARTNNISDAIFADSNGDGLPNGWLGAGGAAGVDYEVPAAVGPDGGDIFRLADTGVNNRGIYYMTAANLTGGVRYTCSALIRRTADGAAVWHAFETQGGSDEFESLGALAHDWRRYSHVKLLEAVPLKGVIELRSQGDPPGLVDFCLPIFERGNYPSMTPIPTTGGEASRALERFLFPAGSVDGRKGKIRIGHFVPGYGSTDVTDNHVFFAQSMTDYFAYRAADDRIIAVNGGVVRAQSAPLAFAGLSDHVLDLAWGPLGSRVTVDGVMALDATPWVQPAAPAPSLGGLPDGTLTESAGYADVEVWAAL